MDISLENDPNIEQTTFMAGDTIFKTGQAVDFLYILKSGEVVCFSSEGGQIVPLYTVSAEGMLGDEASICLSEYNYNAVATEESVVVKVAAADIKSFLKSSPNWIKSLMDILSNKIIETQSIITELKIRDEMLTLDKELEPTKLQLLTKAIKD
jgi:CRP-like cAMP-binding protein